ncbi:MAG: hypothetical protein NVS4B7_08040 [Ktedonobacteraceae bacterium]
MQSQSTTPMLNIAQSLRDFWRLPSLTVARFTLVSYVRSGWVLVDIVGVWLLYAIFFLEFGGNVSYFYGTAGQGLGALTILSTVIMGQRALRAQVYLPLSRLTSRAAYMRGLVIATGALRVPSFLLLMLLAASYHEFVPPACAGIGHCIVDAAVGSLAVGAVGLLANCVAIATLIVVFSAPIATRRARIILLAWLAAVLYSNTNLGPVASVLGVSRVLLWPLTVCYGFGATGSMDWVGVGALVIMGGYVVGLTLLGQYWMRKRDLILQ